ncbi:flagellar hook-associated protein FlgK [Aestuariirhabdus litorea]|uniref:Flagellar hook-associated protein 1 n=1 Tax=Aestuariirhabdus litorea TaxID=2528527 RepID=A0A3P3VQK4_9GAMM|nr:flagellar hook-associated protein FlgK [Aestuariirhabdus litorea]RRJ85005.1 flagellar hook-associated protein FlgK [Aestuariirhabdus litorea]RWW98230.1 flagellar hook-associated protein FlgK [Endozoicomonadaceae bacterium GTF-13]
MADLLNIGLSGLRVSQTSLTVTGHNVANLNTPGYSRQEATQVTRAPLYVGVGFLGSGVETDSIRRITSDILVSQLRENTFVSAEQEAFREQIEQLDSLLANTTTGLTPAITNFFKAMQTGAEDPSSIPSRQLILTESEGIASRFNTISDRLNQQTSLVNQQTRTVTDQINRLAKAVGDYNDAIAKAEVNNTPANDLHDAREETLRELAELIGITVTPQDDNTINVFVGTGQPLIVGAKVNALGVVPSTDDPERQEVAVSDGTSNQVVTNLLTGGELGGLLRYREEVLDPAFNEIGRLALVFSETINQQLSEGLDLTGNFGANLFRDINDPILMQQRVFPSSNGAGSALEVEITNAGQLTLSDYRLEFSSATNYTLTRLSDGVQSAGVIPAAPSTASVVSPDGFQINLTNNGFTAGERFYVSPTREGAEHIERVLQDPEELAFAAPLRGDADLANRGSGVISQPEVVSPFNSPDVIANQPFDIVFTDTQNFSFVDNSGNGLTITATPNPITPGQPNALTIDVTDGGGNTYQVTLDINGRPLAGDRFTIEFNQNGTSDNRNALKLVDLENKPTTLAGAGVNYADAYGELVEKVGTRTAQSRVDSQAAATILTQSQNARDSLSGVNLDEEAANLIRFENAYNASAQVISVARSIFDTLINTFR